MKLLLSTFLLLSTLTTSTFAAETITCHFTEPFITVKLDGDTNILTMSEYDANELQVNILSTKGAVISTDTINTGAVGSKYKIIDKKTKKEFLELTLTMNASNGMSDDIYPFEAKYGSLIGGCETTTALAVNTFELMDRIINND